MATRRSKKPPPKTTLADLKAFFGELVESELSDKYDWGHQTISYQLARLGDGGGALDSALSVRRAERTVCALAQVAILLPATPAGHKALETAEKLADQGLLQSSSYQTPNNCDVAGRIQMELGAAKAAMGDAAAARAHFEQAISPPNLLPRSGAHKDPALLVVALTRAGDAERACAILAKSGSKHEPAELANAIQLLFEEGHTSGALQLLTLLRDRWGFEHETDLAGAAIRGLAAEGRYGEALELLACPTISFDPVPHRLEVIASWAAAGEEAKEQAIAGLEALIAADPDASKADYLPMLSTLAPQRALPHLASQIEEMGKRAEWYTRTVAAAAARLGQAEAALAMEDELQSPLARVALRAALLAEGHDVAQHLEAALAIIDDDATMKTWTAEVEDNRRVALLDLAAALHAVDATAAVSLFERVQSAIVERGGDDQRHHLSDLLRSRANAGDLEGALATLMTLSAAHRCHSYAPLLEAHAHRGDLAGVLTVVSKLGGSNRTWERAHAVVTGFQKAARSTTKRWPHGPRTWPPL